MNLLERILSPPNGITIMPIHIPKIILQQWLDFSRLQSSSLDDLDFEFSSAEFSPNPLPEHWESSPISIRTLMPSWSYVQMNNEIAEHLLDRFPDFEDTYNSLEYPIMKVDALRYMWLYLYGGIYMDLDIELVQSLDDLFEVDTDLYLVKSGNTKSVYTNSFLASKARCDFWLECLNEIKKPYAFWMVGKHLKVMGKTGPLMLSRVVERTLGQYSIHELPNKKLMPCSLCDPKPCTKPEAYTKALEGSSWCSWDSAVFTTCQCNWQYLLLFILVIAIVVAVWW